jgi:hypothetical protein
MSITQFMITYYSTNPQLWQYHINNQPIRLDIEVDTIPWWVLWTTYKLLPVAQIFPPYGLSPELAALAALQLYPDIQFILEAEYLMERRLAFQMHIRPRINPLFISWKPACTRSQLSLLEHLTHTAKTATATELWYEHWINTEAQLLHFQEEFLHCQVGRRYETRDERKLMAYLETAYTVADTPPWMFHDLAAGEVYVERHQPLYYKNASDDPDALALFDLQDLNIRYSLTLQYKDYENMVKGYQAFRTHPINIQPNYYLVTLCNDITSTERRHVFDRLIPAPAPARTCYSITLDGFSRIVHGVAWLIRVLNN